MLDEWTKKLIQKFLTFLELQKFLVQAMFAFSNRYITQNSRQIVQILDARFERGI